MNWLTIATAVINALRNDPALIALEAELWAWILRKIHTTPTNALDPSTPGAQAAAALIAAFKAERGL